MSFSKENKRVAVITATIGHPFLERALRSVQTQSYSQIDHYIIVDGPEFEERVRPIVNAVSKTGLRTHFHVLPIRTGMGGWCSHRIYAAIPFLVDADFIVFLDQDNWFDKTHIESLLLTINKTNSAATYSLRNIYDQAGTFVCPDECQSLGILADSWDTPGKRHIDTNCWLLSRQLAIDLAPHWCQPYIGDRIFAAKVMDVCPDLSCTGMYSVNYTASSRTASAPEGYFLRGNQAMRKRYPDGVPWS